MDKFVVRTKRSADGEPDDAPGKKRQSPSPKGELHPDVLELIAPLTDPEWKEALAPEFRKPYFRTLATFVKEERAKKTIFPPAADVFTALNSCPISEIKAVMFGQDPYHDNGQAHGLCFSVKPGVKVPPSLRNIYKELKQDPKIKDFDIPPHGYLLEWAQRGVMLLNAVLTVEAHKANSHKGKGWEKFTDAVVKVINEQTEGVVFLLFGKPAEKKAKDVSKTKHHIVTAPHPSPLSAHRGFFDSGVFSQANELLVADGRDPIDWTVS